MKISREKIKKICSNLIFWIRFAAYGIPLAFLVYVLYLNFLPFGYDKTYTIKVGADGDTSGEFYLEPSRYLSERKTAGDGTTYRDLDGYTIAVWNPSAVLNNATVTVSVKGEGISLIPSSIDFNPSAIKWDYAWDFTKQVPKDLTGDTFVFDGGTWFDGNTSMELASSSDLFEDGPFSVYVEWAPKNNQTDAQQIVGHFNWNLMQNRDSVIFGVGRMNNKDGPFHSIKYPITSDFFSSKHTALAIYNPEKTGFIDFFVDGKYVGRTYFGRDIIWTGYGNYNISLGKSHHGNAAFFKGYFYKVSIASRNVFPPPTKLNIHATDSNQINISILSTRASTLKEVTLHAIEK
jgi:hypothetical protein